MFGLKKNLGFCWRKWKGNLGCGDETQFLQRSFWGKIGNCLDALKGFE